MASTSLKRPSHPSPTNSQIRSLQNHTRRSVAAPGSNSVKKARWDVSTPIPSPPVLSLQDEEAQRAMCPFKVDASKKTGSTFASSASAFNFDIKPPSSRTPTKRSSSQRNKSSFSSNGSLWTHERPSSQSHFKPFGVSQPSVVVPASSTTSSQGSMETNSGDEEEYDHGIYGTNARRSAFTRLRRAAQDEGEVFVQKMREWELKQQHQSQQDYSEADNVHIVGAGAYSIPSDPTRCPSFPTISSSDMAFGLPLGASTDCWKQGPNTAITSTAWQPFTSGAPTTHHHGSSPQDPSTIESSSSSGAVSSGFMTMSMSSSTSSSGSGSDALASSSSFCNRKRSWSVVEDELEEEDDDEDWHVIPTRRVGGSADRNRTPFHQPASSINHSMDVNMDLDGSVVVPSSSSSQQGDTETFFGDESDMADDDEDEDDDLIFVLNHPVDTHSSVNQVSSERMIDDLTLVLSAGAGGIDPTIRSPTISPFGAIDEGLFSK